MTPLKITAMVPGLLSLPWSVAHLDGILGAEIAAREGWPPPQIGGLKELTLPLARDPLGFWLASASILEWECMETLYRQRRFPTAEALARHDSKMRRLDTSVGPQKNTRIPVEAGYVRDLVTFYAIGDRERIKDLLSTVRALGSQRGSGKGEVTKWTVEDVEPWPGFPCVRDSRALRNLPADYPDATIANGRIGRLEPPYWWSEGRTEVLCPVSG